jgi:MoaA/NifB/PqqE/SkfB family radical SAM enzyme
VLRALLHRVVPAGLYGGRTAFSTLEKIDRDLRQCTNLRSAVALLETSKADLYARLRHRSEATAAQALALKILNICLGRYHFHARSSTLLSRPVGLVVDPSNVCQLACPGCVHSASNEALKLFDWPKGTLSEDRFAALLARYGAHAVGIYFCDYGEPLLNLNTPKLIRMAKRYLLSTALSTSLSVRKLDADAVVESGLDFMVMSIDGVTQAVYEKFRRNGDLELVLTNVRKLVEAKRRLKRQTPVLSWNFLAFEHNSQQIPEALRMARRLGVDQFRIVNPFDVGWDDPQIRPAAAVTGRVRHLHRLSGVYIDANWNPFPDTLEATEIARAFEKPWPAAAESIDENASSGHTCHWLYKNMVMDATGRILPCCGAPRPDTKLVFGTFDGNGSDPFNSEKYRQARAFFAGDGGPAADALQCSQCDWDQTTVNIGGPEIRRYFRAADPAFFDRRSLSLLAEW